VETNWLTQTILGTNWVFKSVVTDTIGTPQRTEYTYETGRQGGRQFGNVTLVREYSDGGVTLYRTREITYYPQISPLGEDRAAG
jgi:hypothetical protein